jgi:hypothetical protein
MTKLQGHLTRVIINAATPSRCTTLTLMAAGLQRIVKRILDHLHKKEVRELLSKGQTSITREGMHQDEATIMAEAHTHSSLRTTCTTAVKPTTAQ